MLALAIMGTFWEVCGVVYRGDGFWTWGCSGFWVCFSFLRILGLHRDHRRVLVIVKAFGFLQVPGSFVPFLGVCREIWPQTNANVFFAMPTLASPSLSSCAQQKSYIAYARLVLTHNAKNLKPTTFSLMSSQQYGMYLSCPCLVGACAATYYRL